MDIKAIQTQFKKAKEKLKKDYLEGRNHNYKLYSGETKAKTNNATSANADYINEVYPNVEIQRVNIGFRFPRTDVKAKRPMFLIKKVRGEVDYSVEDYTTKDSFNNKIFEAMKQVGLESYDHKNNGKVITYTILDGNKTSNILQSAINNFATDKNIEDEIDIANSDALVAGVGAVWVDYYSDFFLPTEDSDTIKQGDIVVKSGTLGIDYLYDTSIRNLRNLNQAGWVAKRFFVAKGDVQYLKTLTFKGTKDEKGNEKPIFIESALKNLMEDAASTATLYCKDSYENDEYKSGAEDSRGIDEGDLKDSVQGYMFWLVVQKASVKDKIEKNKFQFGRMYYIVEGLNEKICNDYPWNKKSDRFPLKLLQYNLSGSKAIPVTDIKIYESQVADLANEKYNQRLLSNLSSKIKMILDTTDLKVKDVERIADAIGDPNNRVIPIAGFKSEKVQQLTINTQGSQTWRNGGIIEGSIQKYAMTSDAQKSGAPSQGDVSATAVAVADRSSNLRNSFRQYRLSKFWVEVLTEISDLMQQFYDKPRMVEITGKLDAEWTTFDRSNIQGEYNISVDVMTLAPADIQAQKAELVNLFNLMLGLVKEPQLFMKVISEGKTINLTEILDEILQRANIGNTNILPDVEDPNSAVIADQLFTQKTGVPDTGNSGSGGKSNTAVAGIKLPESNITETGATGGTAIGAGEVMPNGGQGKVLDVAKG